MVPKGMIVNQSIGKETAKQRQEKRGCVHSCNGDGSILFSAGLVLIWYYCTRVLYRYRRVDSDSLLLIIDT
jgi:hypothetical protein